MKLVVNGDSVDFVDDNNLPIISVSIYDDKSIQIHARNSIVDFDNNIVYGPGLNIVLNCSNTFLAELRQVKLQ